MKNQGIWGLFGFLTTAPKDYRHWEKLNVIPFVANNASVGPAGIGDRLACL